MQIPPIDPDPLFKAVGVVILILCVVSFALGAYLF